MGVLGSSMRSDVEAVWAFDGHAPEAVPVLDTRWSSAFKSASPSRIGHASSRMSKPCGKVEQCVCRSLTSEPRRKRRKHSAANERAEVPAQRIAGKGKTLRAEEATKIAADGPLQRSHILTGVSTKGKPVRKAGTQSYGPSRQRSRRWGDPSSRHCDKRKPGATPGRKATGLGWG